MHYVEFSKEIAQINHMPFLPIRKHVPEFSLDLTRFPETQPPLESMTEAIEKQ